MLCSPVVARLHVIKSDVLPCSVTLAHRVKSLLLQDLQSQAVKIALKCKVNFVRVRRVASLSKIV